MISPAAMVSRCLRRRISGRTPLSLETLVYFAEALISDFPRRIPALVPSAEAHFTDGLSAWLSPQGSFDFIELLATAVSSHHGYYLWRRHTSVSIRDCLLRDLTRGRCLASHDAYSLHYHFTRVASPRTSRTPPALPALTPRRFC
jgi:hypothetical protein